MRLSTRALSSSPTDLANFLACRHKTLLEVAAAVGRIARPEWEDPLANALRERGQAHERTYVDRLRAQGLHVVDLTTPEGVERPARKDAAAETLAVMRAGADVIVQAALLDDDGRWFGYADVLRRVEGESTLGAWHYEAHDTKLARETRGGTILQLCVYSEILETIQQRRPEHFRVVTPEAAEDFRLDDFAAYYRSVLAEYRRFVDSRMTDGSLDAVYPQPVEHCDVCRWSERCHARRRRDDHLSFVAGLGRSQQTELEGRGVRTLAALAAEPVPIAFTPTRGSKDTYARLREQARVQREQRDSGKPVHELLPVEAGLGLCLLPEPSPGDLFLDLEGDPFARPADSGSDLAGGREYLFGIGNVDANGEFVYRARWAFSDDEERAAFEAVLDEIQAAIAAHPGAHVYHFAAYESSTFKRLMGRHATRETEMDGLLRGGRFVDLYAVVRQALRAGVESYSIKKLEPFYEFVREAELQRAGDERRLVELAIETGDVRSITAGQTLAVETYNKDDCRSTLALRDWLEKLRATEVKKGVDISRPVSKPAEANEKITERQQRIEALRAKLLAMAEIEPLQYGPESPSLSSEPQALSPGTRALKLLAFLIDWHYREDKATWWEYYRLLRLSDDELVDEPAAVTELSFVARLEDVVHKVTKKPTGSVIDRYTYPPQDMEIRADRDLKLRADRTWGRVVAVDRAARTIDVRKGPSMREEHVTSAFAHERVSPDVPAASLFRLAELAVAEGLDTAADGNAGLGLLVNRRPVVAGMELSEARAAAAPGESVPVFATRVAPSLGATVLPIQGPPGSGKTYTGARMICALVAVGKRVGVTANSHRVIRNLLEAVASEARKIGQDVRLGHKGDADDVADGMPSFEKNEEVAIALRSHTVDVVGGTAWLWSDQRLENSVDVLFVDEAGQMSLANAIAVSPAATSVVLLGDPQQLDQPRKGSHPDGVDISALQHVLGEHQTMPAENGLFLPETWRLAPAICDYTSEMFYEGKLTPKPGLEAQRLEGSVRFDGAGLRLVEVEHDGCRNSSDEEVEIVAAIVEDLLRPGVVWIDEHEVAHPITPNDILVVAPFNAHIIRLQERLNSGSSPPSAARGSIRVGTVDKFQGQEAPIVIYSMATSRPEDAPRGMKFLYSLNRLNVATSRARCVSILVASSRLFEPDCQTPAQMRLANALCRFREMAGRA